MNNMMLTDRATVHQALEWLKANAEHDQQCDVLDLDDDGLHKPCSCGLSATLNRLSAALAAPQPEKRFTGLVLSQHRDPMNGASIPDPFRFGAAPQPAHPDDAAVNRFATEMKRKLAAAREKGRGGWETCPPDELSRMLREHVEKGDPRDVANFCMFLWALGRGIAPQPAQEPFAYFNPNVKTQIMEAAERDRYAGRTSDSGGMVAYAKACTAPLYTTPQAPQRLPAGCTKVELTAEQEAGLTCRASHIPGVAAPQPAQPEELAEADRRAGEAERKLAQCQDNLTRLNRVRDQMKDQWGVDRNVSFDAVWAEALKLKHQAAPRRQPLTDQEIDDLYINGTKHWIGKREVARAVEALIASKGPAA